MGIIYADYYFLEALVRYEKFRDTVEIFRYPLEPAMASSNYTVISPPRTYDLLGRSIRQMNGLLSPGVFVRPEQGRLKMGTGWNVERSYR